MHNRTMFKQRVRDWAIKLEVEVVWLGIRPMRRKWASCSTNGHLNFSTELLSQPTRIQDYVIVHELLHLRVPNHGKLFKSLMRAHLGEWEEVREELNASLPEVLNDVVSQTEIVVLCDITY